MRAIDAPSDLHSVSGGFQVSTSETYEAPSKRMPVTASLRVVVMLSRQIYKSEGGTVSVSTGCRTTPVNLSNLLLEKAKVSPASP